MVSDHEIIQAVLRGDRERYGELVSRYQLAAWKLAYSFVGNFEDAKDLSQNGFVKAYQNLAQFRGKSEFSTWLYRIIVNECKDFFKSKARRPASVPLVSETDGEEPVLFEMADPSGDPSDTVANRELAGLLSASIRRLPMKQRMAFVLHHLQGMTLEKVSKVMGCRVGTVKSHLFRGCENLRTSLKPMVATEVSA